MSEENPTCGVFDLGVLVVHGIGNQRQMATLKEFGSALVGSMRGWLAPANVAESQQQACGSAPGHAQLSIDRLDDEPLNALVAEGWWADTVPAPGSRTLLKWLFSVVPFVVPRVFDGGLRRSSLRMDGTPRWRPGFLGFALLRLGQNVFVVGVTLSLLSVLLALWVLALPRAGFDKLRGPRTASRQPFWLPIAAGVAIGVLVVVLVPGATALKVALVVPTALMGVVFFTLPRLLNSILANFIGDCYALLRQPQVERAMVGRVEQRLAWLEGQVGNAPIVIVAHSQGSEIVRRVLVERERPVRGLVTYGSAIAKLEAVGHLRDAPWRSTGAFALRICSALLVLLAAYAIATSGSPATGALVAVALVAVAASLLTAARGALRRIVGTELNDDQLGIGPEHVDRWVDLYTANDPVAEGALPIPAPWGRSSEIVNWRVLLVDHVVYWHNVEGFRAAVVLELADIAGRGRDEAVRLAIRAGATARARAVAIRVAVRWMLVVAVIAAFALSTGVTRFVLVGAAVVAGVAAEALLVARARERARGWSPCATAAPDPVAPFGAARDTGPSASRR